LIFYTFFYFGAWCGVFLYNVFFFFGVYWWLATYLIGALPPPTGMEYGSSYLLLYKI